MLPLALDVTHRAADFAAVATAHDHFGRLDVVVNNAGYGQFGMIEELSEIDARDQIETNLFGALWVTQAALPLLRAQRGGHILQVSSIGGISAFPNVGAYLASKWALEGFSQALAQEVAVVDAEKPPLRIFLGEAPLAIATADYESRLTLWRGWQPVSVAAQGHGRTS